MKRLLDLLLPPVCPGCGEEGIALCSTCREQLGRRIDEPAGLPLGLAARQPAGLAQVEWCAAYSGPARASLHALKYDGELRLVEPLAGLMAERWQRAGIGGDVLVAVPVHADRRRQRGFDQAELLAREIGRRLRLPYVAALRRQARTVAQHGLGRGDRAGNVGGVFAVDQAQRARVAGRWVIVVDDVITTGATVAACATALRAGGALAVSALSLASER